MKRDREDLITEDDFLGLGDLDDMDCGEDLLPRGKPVHVHCGICGAQMVIRTNRRDGSQFCGCSRYPDCKFTTELPEDLLMEQRGQRRLI